MYYARVTRVALHARANASFLREESVLGFCSIQSSVVLCRWSAQLLRTVAAEKLLCSCRGQCLCWSLPRVAMLFWFCASACLLAFLARVLVAALGVQFRSLLLGCF